MSKGQEETDRATPDRAADVEAAEDDEASRDVTEPAALSSAEARCLISLGESDDG